jgi:hypothetical protein
MDDFDEAFAALGDLKVRPLFVMKVGVDHIHAIGGPAGMWAFPGANPSASSVLRCLAGPGQGFV